MEELPNCIIFSLFSILTNPISTNLNFNKNNQIITPEVPKMSPKAPKMTSKAPQMSPNDPPRPPK